MWSLGVAMLGVRDSCLNTFSIFQVTPKVASSWSNCDVVCCLLHAWSDSLRNTYLASRKSDSNKNIRKRNRAWLSYGVAMDNMKWRLLFSGVRRLHVWWYEKVELKEVRFDQYACLLLHFNTLTVEGMASGGTLGGVRLVWVRCGGE